MANQEAPAKTCFAILLEQMKSALNGLSPTLSDVDRKNLYFDIIMGFTGEMYKTFGVEDLTEINIDRGIHFAGQVYTYVQFLKRLKNTASHENPNASRNFSNAPSYPPKTISVPTFHGQILAHYPGLMEKIDPTILMPIAAIITNFNCALEEVRVGLMDIPKNCLPVRLRKERKRKNGKKDISAPLRNFGLSGIHVTLLHGLTYPPERQTIMLRGLGPLTLLLKLYANPQYPDKIRNAISENLGHIEFIDQVMNVLQLNSEAAMSVLRVMADLILMTSHKGVRRFYLPLEVYMLGSAQHEKGINGKFSFNGADILILYMVSTTLPWKMRGRLEHVEHLKQYIFHAMFTAGLENLNILSQITNQSTWMRRTDITGATQKRADCTEITLTPIAFKYISKGSRALPTRIGGQANPMSTSDYRFSGTRVRTFGEAFATYQRQGTSYVPVGDNVQSVITAINKLKSELVEKLDDPDFLRVGTTNWDKVVYADNMFTRVPDPTFTVQETLNSYFYN